ncbi:hypothetical protein [Marinobacterium lutimaris]|uniref:hypothetical protein n=1 Tax=Marinobacterium lutimaris TaxID=568106 RepID=UPI00135775BE|nr:hypothetical protein [Marinobacterium lutimaris]
MFVPWLSLLSLLLLQALAAVSVAALQSALHERAEVCRYRCLIVLDWKALGLKERLLKARAAKVAIEWVG